MAAVVERSLLVTLRARIEPEQEGAATVTVQRHHLSGQPVMSDAMVVLLPDEALALVRDWLHEFEAPNGSDER